MTNALLDRLEQVRVTGHGKWTARCPAHDDRRPSLSIRESDDRILLHCFAGCHHEDICDSLGLSLRDLFIESDFEPHSNTTLRKARPVPLYQYTKMLRDYSSCLRVIGDEYYFHAQRILEAATRVSIEDWTDNELEKAWTVVGRAHTEMKLDGALQDLAFDLHNAALEMDRNHESRCRKVA